MAGNVAPMAAQAWFSLDQVDVAPGSTVVLQLTVVNLADTTDAFVLTPSGLAAAWIFGLKKRIKTERQKKMFRLRFISSRCVLKFERANNATFVIALSAKRREKGNRVASTKNL